MSVNKPPGLQASRRAGSTGSHGTSGSQQIYSSALRSIDAPLDGWNARSLRSWVSSLVTVATTHTVATDWSVPHAPQFWRRRRY
jgi:hypothetical protein